MGEVLDMLGILVMDSILMKCLDAAKQITVLEIVNNQVQLCIQNVDPDFMLKDVASVALVVLTE
jgi:hypothetical protein